MTEPVEIDVFWSFRSPWSYLATRRLRDWQERYQLNRRIVAEADRLESVIENNQTDHDHSGHWGVPTCVYGDEPFFGQDRLDVLLWRLKKEGLQARVDQS